MGALDAAVRLGASLDEVAAALAAPDAAALLAAEAGLAATLADLRVPPGGAQPDPELAAAVARARATLARCRVLGASLADVTRLTLAGSGYGSEYGPSGQPAHEAGVGLRGHRLRARL
jgi:hypothetical protein